jgi:hypothetical protein
LYAAHGDRIAVVSVVAGDDVATPKWAREHQSPYLVTPDTDRMITWEFGAKRSACTTLVVGGRIVRL